MCDLLDISGNMNRLNSTWGQTLFYCPTLGLPDFSIPDAKPRICTRSKCSGKKEMDLTSTSVYRVVNGDLICVHPSLAGGCRLRVERAEAYKKEKYSVPTRLKV